MKDDPGLLDKLAATLSALLRGWKLPVGVEPHDLVQEVCSRCLRQIPPVGDGGADEARLLLGVAKNVAREWWRAERLRERHHAKVAGWRGKFGVEEHTLMNAEELRAGLLRRLVGLRRLNGPRSRRQGPCATVDPAATHGSKDTAPKEAHSSWSTLLLPLDGEWR